MESSFSWQDACFSLEHQKTDTRMVLTRSSFFQSAARKMTKAVDYSKFHPLFSALEISEEKWPPSMKELDATWKKLAKELHPDKTSRAESNEEVIIIISVIFMNFVFFL